MHFKRLEVFGFKSFAEKTVLDFNPGVTSIVGPNGCGKSNISDAIKWVLGEQSAKSIRGTKMEDIIFNGTQTQDPVNFAEVSVTFTNEDKRLPIEYDEVVISRRLYRSGESAYMINKNPVRLKDIHSLLAGTGLGVGNYSVIEQGRIDRILNAKPDDRRHLFEEAAGITKFKQKKREATRNLEATDVNLIRVNDITAELKRQIGSLERQAKKAEKYKKDFEILKTYDIYMAANEIVSLKEKKGTIEIGSEEAQRQLQEGEARVAELNEQLSQARESFAEIEQQYAETKSQYAIFENQLTNADEKTGIFNRYLEEVSEKLIQLDSELTSADLRIEQLNIESVDLQANHDAILTERQSGEEKLKDIETKASEVEDEVFKLESLILDVRNGLEEGEVSLHSVRRDMVRMDEARNTLVVRKADLRAQYNNFAVSMNDIQLEMEQQEKGVSELSLAVRTKISEREDAEEAFNTGRNELRTVLGNERELHDEITTQDSRIEILEGLLKRHEGFSAGARFLLEERNNDPQLQAGILGALADLVEVDSGYELALEVALQQYAQAVVCRTSADVVKACGLIKDNDKGKAVLLSLDFVQSARMQSNSSVGVFEAKRLSEFTRTSGEASRFYQHLIDHIYVVNGGESEAMDLARIHPDCTFVTQSGSLFKGALAVVESASTVSDSALFGRDARLKESKTRLVDLKLEVSRIDEQKNGMTNKIQALEETIKSLIEDMPKIQVKLADTQSRLEHSRADYQTQQIKMSEISKQVEGIEDELGSTSGKDTELRMALGALKINLSALRQSISTEEKRKEALSVEKEALIGELARQRSLWETLSERTEQSERDLERVGKAIEHHGHQKTASQREREELEGKQQSTNEDLITLKASTEAMRESRTDLLTKHNELISQKDESVNLVNNYETERAQSQDSLTSNQQSVHKLEMDLQACFHSMERIEERVDTNYQVKLESHLLTQELPEDYAANLPDADTMDILREKIAKIGGINLIAVEEYDDLTERYSFLDKERDDLLKAKEDIQKAILKINRTTKDMFLETFTQIQTYFVEYFKLLFGGGNAEIVLLDENNVLDSGIEIVARPPGKKLQSITLMSGGEKALTAIALMFAVFKVKPSPFCVLDEIDAPLDDVNVQRFVNVLQEFIKESQFIIITHNKRTMSVADVLYGVTMQKSGMSNVVSVKFADETTKKQVQENKELFTPAQATA
ncbi:MAG: chromosome segregation protein [Candidatus Omnitrophota bacterium]|jgi:chromosome segregation protein